MTRCKPGFSVIGNNRSVNFATTTAHLFLSMWIYHNCFLFVSTFFSFAPLLCILLPFSVTRFVKLFATKFLTKLTQRVGNLLSYFTPTALLKYNLHVLIFGKTGQLFIAKSGHTISVLPNASAPTFFAVTFISSFLVTKHFCRLLPCCQMTLKIICQNGVFYGGTTEMTVQIITSVAMAIHFDSVFGK